MIIALDAGHYNDTPGKRCLKRIDPNETRERFLNARMAEHVEELLKAYDCEVMRCDDRTGKTDPSLSERAARANRAGAGAFISIHHNAILRCQLGHDLLDFIQRTGCHGEHLPSKCFFIIYQEIRTFTSKRSNSV